VAEYLSAGMRLYLDRLTDWPALLRLWKGEAADAGAEVGAYRSVLETAAAIAAELEPAAREHWAEEGELTADGGAVSPPHIRAGYERLRGSGLVSLTVAEAYGGYSLPLLVQGMCLEMIARADPSLMMVVGLQSGAAGDIQKYGGEEVKRLWLPRFVSGEVQGCMDLTEPQAGSDLGGITTRATELPDGCVRVDGQKIFISNGGAEVHLVLARDAESFDRSKGTTHGLSLVLVPRHREDGAPNGVRVARLEQKLGIHGSTTCEVVFDGALGTRLGEKGRGFRAMLDLMNAARLGVAAQALGLCEAAVHDAVAYAHQRRQFGKPIAEQPLVRAMLAKMVMQTEAVRALLYRTYKLLDLNIAREAALARGELPEPGALQAELERDTTRIRLLTPLCKYFATEVACDLTRDAIQVLGGVGFTLDADVGKYHADSLITTIYEGTSEIQVSFALKEIGKGALAVMFRLIREQLAEMQDDPARAVLADRVEQMTHRIDEAARSLFSDFDYALLRSKLLAEMVIDVGAATELLQQAGADPTRLDLAAAFIRRRALEVDHTGRRIAENVGRIERDASIVARAAAAL
jgi:alkylation response protein AidB-like acyl-CoA dehydrogenase